LKKCNGRNPDPQEFQITGKLIVVEGIDGSGKSTSSTFWTGGLEAEDFQSFQPNGTRRRFVREITSKGKKKGLLHTHDLQPTSRYGFCGSI